MKNKIEQTEALVSECFGRLSITNVEGADIDAQRDNFDWEGFRKRLENILEEKVVVEKAAHQENICKILHNTQGESTKEIVNIAYFTGFEVGERRD